MQKGYWILPLMICLNMAACSHAKKSSGKQTQEWLTSNMFNGKWRNEDDPKYILVFTKNKCIELYDKDTTGVCDYKLSDSCSSTNNSAKVSLQNAFVTLRSPEDDYQRCYEIMNLEQNILSWMYSINGRVFVFIKIKD